VAKARPLARHHRQAGAVEAVEAVVVAVVVVVVRKALQEVAALEEPAEAAARCSSS
jgi:hypothetical protein